MSSKESRIVDAARAWALALAELEAAKQEIEADGETLVSAELAMHSLVARVAALKSAERALYQAIKGIAPP